MSSQVLGIATIKVSGKTLRTMQGAKHDPGGTTRTPVKGARKGDIGYSEEQKESMTECEVMHDADFDVDFFRNATDVTIVFEADTGQSYIVKNAWLVDPPVITAEGGGKVPLKFAGPPSVKG